MEYVELRIFAETAIFYAGLFLKNILYFAKRILSRRSRKEERVLIMFIRTVIRVRNSIVSIHLPRDKAVTHLLSRAMF